MSSLTNRRTVVMLKVQATRNVALPVSYPCAYSQRQTSCFVTPKHLVFCSAHWQGIHKTVYPANSSSPCGCIPVRFLRFIISYLSLVIYH